MQNHRNHTTGILQYHIVHIFLFLLEQWKHWIKWTKPSLLHLLLCAPSTSTFYLQHIERKERPNKKGALGLPYLPLFFSIIIFSQSGELIQGMTWVRQSMIGFPGCWCFLEHYGLLSALEAHSNSTWKAWPLFLPPHILSLLTFLFPVYLVIDITHFALCSF